ncbi:MAG: hypothetical protein LH614_06090 [Pyrinomonadaceae bacterium]|nr:hypothetical protein [Pyrinomonadaceae bacterium]
MEQRLVLSCRLSAVNWRKKLFVLMTALFTVCGLLLTADAQVEKRFEDTAPPPLKILSKDEKSQLELSTDIKQRTKTALELMEMRLIKAEAFGIKEEYQAMFTELGSFHALVDNTLDFLSKNNNDSGKVLNNFKRMELSLRKHITRLELIRRNLPIKYELYVRQLVRHIRDARTRAVEPLFDDTVVPGKKPI